MRFAFESYELMSFFRKACLYAMNLYNFQENLFLFSRNFTIWMGLQLASQSDSFQALGQPIRFIPSARQLFFVRSIVLMDYNTIAILNYYKA